MSDDLSLKQKQKVDGLKMIYDSMKHLTTLSTGILVILVSLVEKIFPNSHKWYFLFPIVLITFLVSICATLLCMLYIGEAISEIETSGDRESLFMRSYLISIASFFLGLLILVIFSIRNFL